ncbi:MAG TPA: sel1 repeat family protein, partial [Gammaproteobacteria bacterium]|nr:sel1 repeat family protein [Gammaproteobacteria bacterium]
MQVWQSKKYFHALTGARFLAAMALLFLIHPPAFSMETWDQLLEKQLQEANNGDADAQYGVGIKYLKGQGVKQDRKEAIRWLKQAATSGHDGAKDKLLRLQDRQKLFVKLLDKAHAGDQKAQYQTGIMYLKGKGVATDGSEARSWIGKAAAQGDRKAITRLGILYYKGEGGTKDYARALKNFNGVSNDSVLAQYYLGEMYAGGKGVRKNYKTAITWYQKAADGGFVRAGGKIINMQEELKMEERHKTNAVRKAKLAKAAAKQVMERRRQEAARQAAATRQAEAT